MIRSITGLFACPVFDREGYLGRLHDAVVDRVVWMLRYLVVVTEGWRPGWFALVPTSLVQGEVEQGRLRLDVARTEAMRCSREPQESPEADGGRICLASSWPPGKVGPLRDDPSLHSVRGWQGYRLQAAHGSPGHVEDVLADDVTWLARYLGVRTGTQPDGRRVLVPVSLLGEIDPGGRRVVTEVSAEAIEAAPGADPASPLDRGLEKKIYGHYDRPPYWA